MLYLIQGFPGLWGQTLNFITMLPRRKTWTHIRSIATRTSVRSPDWSLQDWKKHRKMRLFGLRRRTALWPKLTVHFCGTPLRWLLFCKLLIIPFGEIKVNRCDIIPQSSIIIAYFGELYRIFVNQQQKSIIRTYRQNIHFLTICAS